MAETTDQLRLQLQKQKKQFESKLAALNAVNSALQTENDRLREVSQAGADSSHLEEELAELNEEFQKRLAAKDHTLTVLRDQKARMEAMLQQASSGSSASEAKLLELQDMVESLRQEGEALSRRNGEQEAQLRKLRAGNRDLEAERDRLQASGRVLEAQLGELQEKADRAVSQGAAQIKELEQEVHELRTELRKQVAEAKKEEQEALLRVEAEALRGTEQLLAASQEREAALLASLQELRGTMQDLSEEHAHKEDGLRRQAARLEDRIRQLELEIEGLLNNVSDASKPLLKQIESMAATTAAAAAAADEAERKLLARLKAADAAAADALDRERSALARLAAAEAGMVAAKQAAGSAVEAGSELRSRVEAERRHAAALEAEKDALEQRLAAALAREKQLKAEMESGSRELHEKLWEVGQQCRTLQSQNEQLLQRLSQASTACSAGPNRDTGAVQGGTSSTAPTVPGVVSGSSGVNDRLLSSQRVSGMNGTQETYESGPREASILGTGSSHVGPLTDGDVDFLLADLSRAATDSRLKAKAAGTGPLGMLASALHTASSSGIDAGHIQRTVEVLRQQLKAAEQARDDAAEQLCRAMQQADQMAADAQSAAQLKRQLADMTHRVDVALELLGERNERVEQLESDVVDMKQIFQQQLEICVSQLAASSRDLELLRARETRQPDGNV